MAPNDIYDSETKYERFKENLQSLLTPPAANDKVRRYHCRNAENLEYANKLFLKFEAQDISYVRRNRLLQVFKIIVDQTTKNLKDLNRDDIDKIVAFTNNVLSPKTVNDFKIDLKYIWKRILPDIDEKGRPDETIMPYGVRHLKTVVDKSRQKSREDRITWTEFEQILTYFASKPCIQFYLMLALESLGRPQELLWRRMKDIDLRHTFAKINLTSHGKEGIGILQCIDSYSFLTRWLNVHPFKNNPDSFVFLSKRGKQLKPHAINKHLRDACKKLNINKPVTCYSLKRNGVTFRRLRGDSDVEIQRAARWTSTDQLKTYDMSNQEDAFRIELIKRGLIAADKGNEHLLPKTKNCGYCGGMNQFIDTVCSTCQRPLDTKKLVIMEQEKEKKAKETEDRLLMMEQALAQISQQLQAPTTINWQGQQADLSNSGLSVGQQFTPFNNQVMCQNCKRFHQATEQHNC